MAWWCIQPVAAAAEFGHSTLHCAPHMWRNQRTARVAMEAPGWSYWPPSSFLIPWRPGPGHCRQSTQDPPILKHTRPTFKWYSSSHFSVGRVCLTGAVVDGSRDLKTAAGPNQEQRWSLCGWHQGESKGQ